MDLTPMVDVTFLLLIFFMITASFNLQKNFEVPPAKTEEGVSTEVTEESPVEPLSAEIGPDNIVYVNEAQGTTYDEIFQMLTAEKSDSEETELQITVDPESNHEMRILVVDAATQVGFQSIKSLIKEVN